MGALKRAREGPYDAHALASASTGLNEQLALNAVLQTARVLHSDVRSLSRPLQRVRSE